LDLGNGLNEPYGYRIRLPKECVQVAHSVEEALGNIACFHSDIVPSFSVASTNVLGLLKFLVFWRRADPTSEQVAASILAIQAKEHAQHSPLSLFLSAF
jgi:hypothetical protein